MTLEPRHRRYLAFFAVSMILGLVVRFWPAASGPVVAPSTDSAALAERQFNKLRADAATVPAKEKILEKVKAELDTRQRGLIAADTLAQAQAQLIQIVRAMGRAESPPVEIRTTEGFGIRPLGDAYGEASVSVQVECRVDQLVNLLAAITARPELVSTSDVRVTAANPKEKTVGVRLTISGVVPRKLVPEKKGAAAF